MKPGSTDSESRGDTARSTPCGERDYYRILVENCRSVVWVISDQGRTAYISPNIERIFGFTQQEICDGGNHVLMNRIHPDDLPRVHEQFTAMFASNIPFDAEYRIRRRDDAWIWLHDTATISFERDGERFACGVFSDISPSVLAKKALDWQDGFTNSLISFLPAYFLSTDSTGRIRMINQAMCHATGYVPEEVIGRDFRQTFLKEQDQGRVAEAFMYGTDQTSTELEILTKSHEPLRVEWRSAPVWRPDGQIDYYINFGIDLTDRLRAETALREKDRQFRELAENVSDLIDIVEADGTIRYESPSIERITGYTVEERSGKSMFELIHPEDLPRVTALFEEAPRIPGKISRTEFRVRHKDGSWRYLETIGKNMLDDPVLGALIFHSRDITERKLAEENQLRLERRLRQAQKMEAIGTLAGGIAHDFNNILMGITGFTELLLDETPEGHPHRYHLSQVLQAGLRAKGLVQQILTFSRESEKRLKPIRILSPLKEALKLLRASIPSSIEIVQSMNTRALVMADPTEMHQVIMNLCTNAAQAIRNTGTIYVSLDEVLLEDDDFTRDRAQLKPGPHVKLTVADTGHGMTDEVAGRVFDPFFTTKEKGEGTGMGLSVVHGIVQRHGGAILFESAPGRGTAFHIYLPAVPEECDEEQLRDTHPPGGSETILFVDDEPFLVELETQVLASLGYRVIPVRESEKALALFRENPYRFDAVVTDLTMPRMNGRELARTMLAIRPDLPVVLCSGFSGGFDEEAARKEGIRCLVHKPIIKSEIAAAVRRALDAPPPP